MQNIDQVVQVSETNAVNEPIKIEKHQIFSFFSFEKDFTTGLDNTFGEIVSEASFISSQDTVRGKVKPVPIWPPKKIHDCLRDEYKDINVWTEARLPRGQNLYEPIQSLLSGDETEKCKIFTLTNRAKDLLTKAEFYKEGYDSERRDYQLHLILKNSAKTRYQEKFGEEVPEGIFKSFGEKGKMVCAIPINFKTIEAYLFSTSRVICAAELEITLPEKLETQSFWLQEAVSELMRFASLAWQERPKRFKSKKGQAQQNEELTYPPLEAAKDFTLGSLLASLTCGPSMGYSKIFRTFTYSFVTAASSQEKPISHDHFINRVIRGYTDDYNIADISEALHEQKNFENITHRFSREGGMTLINLTKDNRNPNYITNFETQAFKPTYLPLLIINFHQLNVALDLISKSVDIPSWFHDNKYAPTKGDPWKILRSSVANLHHRFRFKQVSQVSQHNQFHNSCRKVFGLEQLEEQLVGDLEQISQRISEHSNERRETTLKNLQKRFRLLGAFATAAAVGFTTLQICTIVLGYMDYSKINKSKSIFDLFSSGELFSLSLSLIIGLIAFIFYLRIANAKDKANG